jgi:hypothetical protein
VNAIRGASFVGICFSTLEDKKCDRVYFFQHGNVTPFSSLNLNLGDTSRPLKEEYFSLFYNSCS